MADLESLLKSAPIPQSAKADAWDAYQASKNEDDLADRLTKLQVPKSVAADMWDLKRSESAVPAAPTGPQISPQELATRQAASKATFEANQPSLVGGALKSLGETVTSAADLKQNFKNLGSAIMNPTSGNVATGMESTGNILTDAALGVLGGYGAAKGIQAIPRTGRALQTFGNLMGQLENNPLTQGSKLVSIMDALTEGKKLAKSGVELPPVFKATENAISGSSPATYGDLRDLAQTAGRKVGLLQRAFNPPDPRVESLTGRLYGSITDAARSVASDSGLGDLYDQAVNEMRQATTLKKLRNYGIGAAGGALLGGGIWRGINTIRDITGY